MPIPAAAVRGDTAALARVGRDFNGPALDAVLDDGFALGSFEQVVDSWLMPALAQLGAAWRDGSVSVAGEHFVSAAVQRRLAASFDAAGRSVTGPCVVVGLARGCRHELGVLAFAAALRRAGLSVVYVGGDLPPEEWVRTVRAREAVAAVLGVPTPDDVPAVRETVEAVSTAYPGSRFTSAAGTSRRSVVRRGHSVMPSASRRCNWPIRCRTDEAALLAMCSQ